MNATDCALIPLSTITATWLSTTARTLCHTPAHAVIAILGT